MIELRAKIIDDYINKKRKMKDVKEILGKSRKTIYERITKYKQYGIEGLFPKKSGPKLGTTWNRTDEEVENLVCQIAKVNKFWGSVPIAWELEKYGYRINQTTVYRILKRNGIRYYKQGYIPINRHTKRYVKELPGEELQIDVSFPFGRSRRIAIYDSIDDCSRFVISKSYEGYSIENTIDFVKYVLKKTLFEVKTIRTDCGSEFNRGFTDWCNNNGIVHIRNKPYTPQHNGKVERYHYTQRLGDVEGRPFNITLDEANYRLTQRNYYYNYKRRHTGLGMNGMTPVEKFLYVTNKSYFENCHLNSAIK